MPSVVDQAVVLRQWEYSETSQTVALLCRNTGRVKGLAKGARRERGRFSGGFEVLTRGELLAIIKPTSDLATLTEWDLQEIYWSTRRHLTAHRAGMYLVDLTYHAIVDRDPHPGVFEALTGALAHLSEPTEVLRAILVFQWRLLTEIGQHPRLDSAVASSDSGSTRVYLFSPLKGVFLPEELATDPKTPRHAAPWRVRAETVALLQHISEKRDSPADDPNMSPTVERASRFLAEYLKYVLERDLPSRRALFDTHHT